MNGTEILRIALAGVAANKLRSGLTILGMTIGVAAVIILVAVGNGSKVAIQSSINSLGSNVLLVVRSQGGGSGPAGAAARASPSPQRDVAALSDTFNASGRQARLARGQRVAGRRSSTARRRISRAVSPAPCRGTCRRASYKIASGAMFSADDVRAHRRVVVLGPTVVTNLFAGVDPVGSSVRIDGTSFQVVGVTASKGSNGLQDQDDIAFAPLTAVQDVLTGYGSGLSSITIEARDASSLDAAQAEVTSILTERKDVTDPANPGFQVINQGSVREVAWRRPTSSRRCSARSPRSRCWSAGSA